MNINLRAGFVITQLLLIFALTSCTTHHPDVSSMQPETPEKQPKPTMERQSPEAATPSIDQPVTDIAPVIEPKDALAETAEKSAVMTLSADGEPRLLDRQSMPASEPIDVASLNADLFMASEQGSSDQVMELIAQGANVNFANERGETALHAAAARNNTQAAKMLIDNGADVNASTIAGWTPLHSAARFGSHTIVMMLLQSGANKWARNDDGKLPIDLARQVGHASVVDLLQ